MMGSQTDQAGREAAAKVYADSYSDAVGLNRNSILPTAAGLEVPFWQTLLPVIDLIVDTYLAIQNSKECIAIRS